MTTQLVVVIPMPATLGLPGSANLPVPANVRAVTASCSPATEGGPLRWRNFYARHFRPAVARARLPKQLLFHDLRHACAALLIANGPAYGGNEGSPRAVVDSGHVRSVRGTVPACSSGSRRRARRDFSYRNAASAGGADVRPLRHQRLA
jgi:hypothetical protein